MFVWTYWGLFRDSALLFADILQALCWGTLLALGWTAYWGLVLVLHIISGMLDVIRFLVGNSLAALWQIVEEAFQTMWEA